MNDKKKKYVLPEADVVDFTNEDIITESLTAYDEYNGWGDSETTDTLN